MRYVIIGNSAAGISAAEAIRDIDGDGRIDIITDESHPAYARCLTSYYLEGTMPDEKLYIRPLDFYEKNNFTLHTGIKAAKVDTERRVVLAVSGEEFSFDKLLIATGASSAMPDVPGVASKGIFGLRTLNDAKNILSYACARKRAVVLGGGFVALKAAYALHRAGASVTCLVSSGQVLSQMLDGISAGMVADMLFLNGIQIEYDASVSEFTSDGAGAVTGVVLTNGWELPADVVVVGKGVIPNTGLLEGSGLEVEQGIMVDKHMQTSKVDVYAAGDVAQTYDLARGRHRINAIWPNATEQGRVAGRNMAGARSEYPGSIGMNAVNFFGLSVIAAGFSTAQKDGDYEVHELSPGKGIYRRFIFKNDHLVGYILVGGTEKAGILTSLIKEQISLGKAKKELVLGNIRYRLLW